jgi:hypothetical protein
MTTANEISNDQIRRFFQKNIQGKKGIYFLISTGEASDHKMFPLHEVSEEYKGEKKFFEMLEDAFDEDPYSIGISVYKKSNGTIPKKSFDFKKVLLKKERIEQSLSGTDALDTFGGFQGVLEAQINSRYLNESNQNLKDKIAKLEKDNEELKRKAEVYIEKNAELTEEIKDRKWTIKTLEEDHKRKLDHLKIDTQRELDGIQYKNDRLEKILTVGGVVAAKVAGIEESDMRGLLGIDDSTKSIEQTGKESLDTSDIDIEEVEEFEGKKAEAKQMIDGIYTFLLETLKANSETDAYQIIASFTNIINYARADFKNLKSLNDIVTKASRYSQSPADTIIEQAKNYQS